MGPQPAHCLISKKKKEGKKTDLDEHELLHGLHPLQQHDAGLKGSTQVLVACVRVTDCVESTAGISDVELRLR